MAGVYAWAMFRMLAGLAVVAACQQNPSKLDSPASAPPPAPTDLEGRIARLERRLDKVIALLEEAGAARSEPDPDTTYSVNVDDSDPQEGPKDAKVTIIEGFEFLCPYCYMVNPTVEQIRAKYPKDVRIVSKYLVIHGEPAIAPGMAACAAAKQGKFTQMKTALWNHFFKMDDQGPKLQRDEVANLEKIAIEAGVDVEKMKTDMESCATWLQTSQDALSPVGVSATPAFFVNGRPISGAVPFEAFDEVIQQELAKADKAIQRGVPQADYYAKEIVAKGEKKVKGKFDD
jgi:protein-disulfide isomerase